MIYFAFRRKLFWFIPNLHLVETKETSEFHFSWFNIDIYIVYKKD